MDVDLITTRDGSHTLDVPGLKERYHSIHGAIQKSKHVFIEMGLCHFSSESLSILEVGFGTGLNAFLTFLETINQEILINYHALEPFPLPLSCTIKLNYLKLLEAVKFQKVFNLMHQCPWGPAIQVTPQYKFQKSIRKVQDTDYKTEFELIYYDAFAPHAQAEMWNEDVFVKMIDALKSGGGLVTYCAKGDVRRTMQKVGFHVQKLPGPRGKREMLRGIKP
ncbi:TPA: SAM-dependent methyltransferase [Candidatus Poribacteria bacterium]|nr:SAM-dependent methyltransferase [Candidatus Poribacteria bacterium]